MALELCLAYDRTGEIGALFTEYTNMLVGLDPAFQAYLCIQHYDAEIADLEGKYGLPEGRLYLALWGGRPAGCVALRRLDTERCEMKRLYVRPAFRKHHIGRALAERVAADAKEIGYRHMLLDTLPPLREAISLYRRMGFYDIPCYNDSPLDTTIFLQLDL